MARLTPPKTVDELAALLQNSAFQAKSDAELRKEAENMFINQRDQAKLSAQQAYDKNALALENQLAGLDAAYAKQRGNQQLATTQAKASADRQALSRGMQRSSYNNATLANLDIAGNKALAQIDQSKTDDVNKVAGQKALLQQQLQESLTGADNAFQNSVTAKLQELRDQQYQRQQQYENINNQLEFELYKLQQQAAKAAGGRGSGGGGSRGGASSPASAAGGVTGGTSYDRLVGMLGAGRVDGAIAGATAGAQFIVPPIYNDKLNKLGGTSTPAKKPVAQPAGAPYVSFQQALKNAKKNRR